MRIETRRSRIAAVIWCCLAVAGCTAQPTASSTASGDAPPVSNQGVIAGSTTDGGQGGVLVGSGHEATTAGDTTGRGGVFVGSGH